MLCDLQFNANSVGSTLQNIERFPGANTEGLGVAWSSVQVRNGFFAFNLTVCQCSNTSSDRLGHVINSDTTEQSPLFLLFLDCTWQLIQQFPEEFEYSETFLTTIWDSAFLPLFDTFQFNSEHERQFAHLKNVNILELPLSRPRFIHQIDRNN